MASTVSNHPFLQNFSLEGKVALITGGSGGIGLGVCAALAESGADVISLQLPSEPREQVITAVQQAGRECHIYNVDLSDLESIPLVMTEVMATHNLSIIINCAGIHKVGPTTEFAVADTERILRINTTASIIVAREAVKSWINDPNPASIRKIVNFASISSFNGNMENLAYVASKGAVLNMTRGMSNEWRPNGICVNCVAPGYTKSRMTEGKYDNEALNEQLFKKIPARRWGEPKDIAAACVYLSSAASDYVSGTCVVVDGGVLAT